MKKFLFLIEFVATVVMFMNIVIVGIAVIIFLLMGKLLRINIVTENGMLMSNALNALVQKQIKPISQFIIYLINLSPDLFTTQLMGQK